MKMHRLILNASDDIQVDHINHNGLDNRKGNLRLCSCSQNCMNRNTRSKTSSRFKGVVWRKKSQKWQSRIHIDGATKYLGAFFNEGDAAMAYNDAALKYHRDFACLNAV